MEGRYLDYQQCYNQLKNQFEKHGQLFIAYDFDDTVHPTIAGDTCEEVRHVIRVWKNHAYLILFTARYREEMPYVLDYLFKNNIPYHDVNVNDNLVNEKFKNTSPKPYFNILLDDKCGLPMTYKMLVELAKEKGFWYEAKI